MGIVAFDRVTDLINYWRQHPNKAYNLTNDEVDLLRQFSGFDPVARAMLAEWDKVDFVQTIIRQRNVAACPVCNTHHKGE